jgi:hypothetical protein
MDHFIIFKIIILMIKKAGIFVRYLWQFYIIIFM